MNKDAKMLSRILVSQILKHTEIVKLYDQTRIQD